MHPKTHCDLCGLRLPRSPFTDERGGSTYFFCCAGCRHVFRLLTESGLIDGNYTESALYKQCLSLGIIGRPERSPSAPELTPADLKDARELVLHLDGMWCSACSWLIEKVLGSQKGVVNAGVVFASDTAKIHYIPYEITAADITKTIEDLGYKALSMDEIRSRGAAERKALLIKMGIALFLLMNIMFFSYVLYIGYFEELAAEAKSLVPVILLVLTVPVVFWCGLPIHRKAWRSLRAGAPTMELLLTMSILSAFFYSLYALLKGDDHFYFDTAAALVTLLLVGKFIERSAKERTAEGIHRLYRMLPAKVRIQTPDGERLVSIETLEKGDRFVVKPGEKIAADGKIRAGSTTVDESLLTGESKPVGKNAGDRVAGSTMNMNGVIEVEALCVGDDTLLSGIIRMVEGALAGKSPLELGVDRVARFFVPAVLLVSLTTAAGLVLSGAGTETTVLRAITVLVIACPCALGLATPLAIAAGVGRAAEEGILVRDGVVLQTAGSVDTVVFDKTGTLTEGRFELLEIDAGGNDAGEALSLLAVLERHSNHPIGDAIVRAAGEEDSRAKDAGGVRITDGMGIEGRVGPKGGRRVMAGRDAFVKEGGFQIPRELAETARDRSGRGHTVVFFGIEGNQNAGCLVLGDGLKPSASEAVGGLAKRGISVSLLSGDSEETTAAVAGRAGIDDYTAEVLPQEKILAVEKLQKGGRTVAMVGDGVNDAPALARADVGIAMGGGTEIAVESSSFTLLRDDLSLVARAFELSGRTVRTIRQNLVWAFLYNTIGIVLAVTGLLNPLIAAAAMLVSSLSVVLNSLSLKEGKGKVRKKLVEFFLPWLEPAS